MGADLLLLLYRIEFSGNNVLLEAYSVRVDSIRISIDASPIYGCHVISRHGASTGGAKDALRAE